MNLIFQSLKSLMKMRIKKMATVSSMDEKLSDLVGSAKYKPNNKIDLGYNFCFRSKL